MNSRSRKLTTFALGAAVAGLLAGSTMLTACSGDAKAQGNAEKNGCNGPNGCGAHDKKEANGCNGPNGCGAAEKK